MYADGQGVEQSYEKTLEWYQKAAEQGDAKAESNLGSMYAFGQGVEQSYERAVEWWKKAAEHGRAGAQFNLATMYHKGRGVKQSIEKAVEWYRKAAEQGLTHAQNKLSLIYAEGQGVEQSDEKAIEWFQKAAEQEDAGAQFNLGLMYHNGRGVKQSNEKAVEWWQKAAERGYAGAQYNLGLMYFNGQGVDQSQEKAVEWWKKAAKQGIVIAQSNLGVCYHNGEGIEKSRQKSAKWYRKAAEQRDAAAQYAIGQSYAAGQGVEQSYEKAVEWFKKAAKQGIAEAQHDLAVMYHKGQGVKQSYEKALKWYKKAADQGDIIAQTNLGGMYAMGQAVIKSNEKAVEWWEKAAEQGNANAQHNLSLMYHKGQGVKQSDEKALEWLKKAAEQKIAEAEFGLGMRCINGLGIEQSIEKAVELWEDAANQGHLKAQLSLGLLSLPFQNTAKTNLETTEWLIKAARQDITDTPTLMGVKVGEYRVIANEWAIEDLKAHQSKAQRLLGIKYYMGYGVLRDEAKAVEWLKKSMRQKDLNINTMYIVGGISFESLPPQLYINLNNNTDCFENLCFRVLTALKTFLKLKGSEDKLELSLLKKMRSEKQDNTTYDAIKDYEDAAKRGEADAQLKLGILHRYGVGITQDSVRAIEWYNEAMQRGNAEAHNILSKIGTETMQCGNSEAHNMLSRIGAVVSSLIRSVGFKPESIMPIIDHSSHYSPLELYKTVSYQKDKNSLEALIKLWRNKNIEACAYLGKLYANKVISRSLEITDEDVFDWLSKAVELHDDPVAQYLLGRMYEYGWGCSRDQILAAACFTEAAFASWYAPAQKALAEVYRYGKGIEQSAQEALRWYRRAAKQGDAGATAAIKEMADEDANEAAMYALGRAHEEGWGIARDEEEAAFQYTRAANQNYPKAQYAAALQRLDGKVAPDELDPYLLLVILSSKEAISPYLKLRGHKLDRTQRKAIAKLINDNYPDYYEQGYYKAQHKLAGLYETGQIILLKTRKNEESAYSEAIRLYEAAMQNDSSVPLTTLGNVRFALRRLQQQGDEERFELDHPGFKKFLQKRGINHKLNNEFELQLAHVFTETRSLEKEVRGELNHILGKILGLPDKSKQAWGMLTMLKSCLKRHKYPSTNDLDISKQDLSELSRKSSLLDPLWSLIPDAHEVATKELRVAKWMLHDPRVEIFNSCFREFENKYDKDIYEGSVRKILTIFDQLHTSKFLTIAEISSKQADPRPYLYKLLTRDDDPTNRFANRLVRIADILQRQFEEAKIKRDLTALGALKELLLQWAQRGEEDCRAGGEDELNRYYFGNIVNFRIADSAALTQEDWTLEMQVAVSLAQLRLKLVDDLVIETDNNRIHAVKHLENKARVAVGLLGDTEDYIDGLD
ncbi:MAG: SEL1-like repeat protein, partial [Alphaproteobacteria bacterium]|nr:SEL1-like repeat protein [Alphaproteobacteria bacterium]